jgi:outer membrane protein assembly factor BamB
MGGVLVLTWALAAVGAQAADWPEWRGSGRHGVWNETGILNAFPKSGLEVKWRVPVRGGFSGPAVADGRVYVLDFLRESRNLGVERILCLDEESGETVWAQEWEADYTGIQYVYASGPRATPTVDGEHVYALGASGILVCLRTKDGSIVWQRSYQEEFGSSIPVWGYAGAPLVDGERLICLVGGEPDAKLVAFDKSTGKELWRALSGETEPGYSSPVIFEAGGRRQLIMWHTQAVTSLDPATGEVFWEKPFPVHINLNVTTPVLSDGRLLVSAFYNGSLLLKLDPDRPGAREMWRGSSSSEIKTDGLHALISTPVIAGDYIYGIGSYGHLRCLQASTGERVWETLDVTGENARWASGLIVRNGDRYFINNDAGELIIARFSPEGYEEIDRTTLIEPTSVSGNRRKAGAVNWSHPAYANRHIVARNDREIIRASLAE